MVQYIYEHFILSRDLSMQYRHLV